MNFGEFQMQPSRLGILNSFMFPNSPNNNQFDFNRAKNFHMMNENIADDCKLIDYRGQKVAAFFIQGKTMLCLPQVFELFLKHLVGGLHTIHSKLKRLDIVPLVCTVEQIRLLRGLGALLPGVNRCKLLASKDFDILYQDCITSRSTTLKTERRGRPPKQDYHMYTKKHRLNDEPTEIDVPPNHKEIMRLSFDSRKPYSEAWNNYINCYENFISQMYRMQADNTIAEMKENRENQLKIEPTENEILDLSKRESEERRELLQMADAEDRPPFEEQKVQPHILYSSLEMIARNGHYMNIPLPENLLINIRQLLRTVAEFSRATSN